MRSLTVRLLVVLTAFAGLASAGLAAVPASGRPIDPQRYSGRWYEVARLPNKIEADCVMSTSDWSRQSDGGFDVVQTCYAGSPVYPQKVWRGSGRITDAATNSKFRIGFFGGLIQKDYWVVDRADDYSWCLLTMPNPKYLWIMARSPSLNAAQKAALVAHARALGFDTTKLVFDGAPA